MTRMGFVVLDTDKHELVTGIVHPNHSDATDEAMRMGQVGHTPVQPLGLVVCTVEPTMFFGIGYPGCLCTEEPGAVTIRGACPYHGRILHAG